MSRPKLELVAVTKEYEGGQVAAVDAVDLSIQAGETLALLGPSGCGKSTMLNMIVGLETPTSGEILIDGHSVVATPPGRRKVGLVFQDYAVFTHMTVGENLAFGLKMAGLDRAKIEREVAEVATILGLSDRLKARARDLGGSDLQRVAIGRTLVTRPSLLLLDEPLSNLDAAARMAMRRELRRLQKEIGLTIIYVTHDQIEALSLADRIAVMSAGKIRQLADTDEIYDRPGHVFVAGFLGAPPMNLLRGKVAREEGGPVFRSGAFRHPLSGVSGLEPALSETEIVFGIRPEAVALVQPVADGLEGTVVGAEPRGPRTVLSVDCRGVRLAVLAPSLGCPPEGALVGLSFAPNDIVLFSGHTSRRLVA